MSLYKQPGSDVWYANISVPGQSRVRRSTGQTDRTEAQKVHDQIKAELWRVDPVLKGRTWGSAVTKWLNAGTRSESELLSLRKFNTKFKDRMLAEVRPDDIDTALSFCRTAGTHARYCSMVGAILHLSGHNIALKSRKAKKKSRDWITHENWDKLYVELPTHLKAPALFSVLTGLRQANALGLEWSRVDLDRAVMWVNAEDMKANRAISIPLSEDAINVLKSQAGKHETYVFTYRKKPIKKPRKAFTEACIRAGVGKLVDGTYRGLTWHGLRHTWATWHVQNGTPLEVLQKLGGWSDLRMVLLYAHHSPSYLSSYVNNPTKNKVRSD